MSVSVLIGAQWGDEGKGKVVDVLSSDMDVVVRFSGGANAGHTLVVNGKKIVLHLVPSGVLHPQTTCVLAQGMVIDPEQLLKEVDELLQTGHTLKDRLLVSDEAFLVMPWHKHIDAMREEKANKIGTTRRGIGPAYEDKIGRRGLRVVDLLSKSALRQRIEGCLDMWAPWFNQSEASSFSVSELVETYHAFGERLKPYVASTRSYLHQARSASKKILLEGAQGALLDVDHGTYPYVTSASVSASGAPTGSGLGPRHIDKVIGVTKAYCTRVGEGPFPTELAEDKQGALREAGDEFGATTGRARRCGWLDLPLLRFASLINSFDCLAITKLDVLSKHAVIPVCVAYEIRGQRVEIPLSMRDLADAKPVLEEMPGWNSPLDGCKDVASLPKAARDYLAVMEKAAGCPAEMISIGADRAQTLLQTRQL